MVLCVNIVEIIMMCTSNTTSILTHMWLNTKIHVKMETKLYNNLYRKIHYLYI
jgi:hypothetical protein